MVEPALKVDVVADVVDEEVDLVGRPADDESTAYHQWGQNSVASGGIYRVWTACRVHLNMSEINTKI